MPTSPTCRSIKDPDAAQAERLASRMHPLFQTEAQIHLSLPLPTGLMPTRSAARANTGDAIAPVHVQQPPHRREAVPGSGLRPGAVVGDGQLRPGHGGGVEGVQVVEHACRLWVEPYFSPTNAALFLKITMTLFSIPCEAKARIVALFDSLWSQSQDIGITFFATAPVHVELATYPREAMFCSFRRRGTAGVAGEVKPSHGGRIVEMQIIFEVLQVCQGASISFCSFRYSKADVVIMLLLITSGQLKLCFYCAQTQES
jgi:hypothetical protein